MPRSTIASRRCARRALAAAVLLLAGCAHASHVDREHAWPTLADRAPTAAATTSAPATPLPVPGRDTTVSLQAILAYADQHSPRLAVARARGAQGDAGLVAAEASALANPELTGSVGPRVADGAVGVDVEVGIEQSFELAGERGLRIEVAQRGRDLLRLELEAARWQVHREVHAAFHAGLVAREQVSAAEKALAFTERMLEIAKHRNAAGDISALDVRVAETETAQARQTKIAADATFRAARSLLAEIAGWPAGSALEPAGELDVPRAAPAAETLLALSKRSNPELRARAQAVYTADAKITLADRESWVEPTVGLSYSRESEPGAGSGAANHVGLLTLGIPLPLWQHNQGDRAQARADATLARAEQQALAQTLDAQVLRAAAAVDAAAERVGAYGTEIVPGFERSLGLLQRAFELGEMDLLDLMVARGRFLEIEHDALGAYGDYYEAVAALEELVGAELWPDEHDGPPGAAKRAP